MNLTCPRCRKPTLVTLPVEDCDFTVEQCSECGGLWFDRDELDAILGELAMIRFQLPPGSRLAAPICPSCHHFMYRLKYPGTYVKVETCINCGGFWLDAGELEEIIAVRRHHLRQYGKADPIRTEMEPDAAPETETAPDGLRDLLIRTIDQAIAILSNDMIPAPKKRR